MKNVTYILLVATILFVATSSVEILNYPIRAPFVETTDSATFGGFVKFNDSTNITASKIPVSDTGNYFTSDNLQAIAQHLGDRSLRGSGDNYFLGGSKKLGVGVGAAEQTLHIRGRQLISGGGSPGLIIRNESSNSFSNPFVQYYNQNVASADSLYNSFFISYLLGAGDGPVVEFRVGDNDYDTSVTFIEYYPELQQYGFNRGDVFFSGSVTASNITGTNTGDQTAADMVDLVAVNTNQTLNGSEGSKIFYKNSSGNDTLFIPSGISATNYEYRVNLENYNVSVSGALVITGGSGVDINGVVGGSVSLNTYGFGKLVKRGSNSYIYRRLD